LVRGIENMDMDNMMNEMGGAFMVAWLAGGMDSLGGALVLAAAWMAISGAHILPVITWGHIMTGDLGDTDAWMDNGTRLVAQVVGAILALMLIGGGTIAGVETETTMWSFDLWDTLGAVAAGALLWTVYDRCDAWVTAFVIMAIVGTGALSFGGASDMGTSLVGGGDDVAAAIVAWVMGGLWAGVGAMVATKVPDLI
jgi:hypothetical protein